MSKRYIQFSITTSSGDLNLEAVLPLTIIIGSLFITLMVLGNALINKFSISFKPVVLSIVIYFGTLIYLVVFCISNDI